MVTVSDRMYESTVGAVRGTWSALGTRNERVLLWLAVAAYGVVYVVLLVCASITAVYLGVLIPGMAGVGVFLTVGLALIGTAPTVARWLAIRSMDAIGAHWEADSGDVDGTDNSMGVDATESGEPAPTDSRPKTVTRCRIQSRWAPRHEGDTRPPSLYWSSANRAGLCRPKRRERDGG